MISTQDIREKILELVQNGEERQTFPLTDVARQLSSENWKNSISQVRLVADTLIKEGKITSIQNGDSFEILKNQKAIL